jgi:hypothetical protein
MIPELGTASGLAAWVMALVAGIKLWSPTMQGRTTVVLAAALSLLFALADKSIATGDCSPKGLYQATLTGIAAWLMSIGIALAVRQPDKRT